MRDGAPVPGLNSEEFKGKLTLVNVWGSWCVPCRQEHPLLMEIAKDERIRVVGLNYKDQPENARRLAISAIPLQPLVLTAPGAQPLNGASTACRKPSSSIRTARSSTSMSGRLRRSL